MSTIEEGIYLDMSESDYRKAPGVNVSSLKDMRLSPAHYKHWQENPDPDKANAALIIGTLVHRAKLEPDKLAYAVRPNTYPATKTHKSVKDGTLSVGDPVPWNSNATWCKEWLAAQTLPVVTEEQVEIVNRSAEALTGFEVFPGITLDDLCKIGKTEVAVFKRHKRTGLMRKARLDLFAVDVEGGKWIIDLKTVPEEGACEEKFSKKIAEQNYHQQAAYYSDMVEDEVECRTCGAVADKSNASTNCEHCGDVGSLPLRKQVHFIFIAVEKAGFPGVAAYQLDAEDLEIGRRTNEALLEQLARCFKTGEWEGYPTGVQTIKMPGWKRKQDGKDIYE
jgi:hypothetical protein